MKNFIEQLGNIKIYTKKNADRDITITFMNGSDIIASEVYFTNDERAAINDLLTKQDIYTLPYIYEFDSNVQRLSDNTYKSTLLCSGAVADWFCRIDNTDYFKHFYKAESEFIRDKDGKRIIDR